VWCKALLKECVQDFIDYYAPGAGFVRFAEGQLQTPVSGSLEDAREIRCDVAVEVKIGRRHFLLHFEFQSTKQKGIATRLLDYSRGLTREHKLIANSITVYTRPFKNLPRGPLRQCIPTASVEVEREILNFNFDTLDVCSTPVEAFRDIGKDGFRPFMLLARGGATFEVLEEVLESLWKHKRTEAAAVAIFFAGTVFKSKKDLEQLRKRRYQMEDFLKKSPIYQQFREEISEEELEAKRAQGLEQGLEQGIEAMVRARFPELQAFIKNRIAPLTDLSKLQEILVLLGTARTEEEVKQSLLVLQ